MTAKSRPWVQIPPPPQMEYLKKQNMLCFEKVELAGLYKASKHKEFRGEIKKRKFSTEDLVSDKAKVHEIVDAVLAKHSNDKEEIEIYLSLFSGLLNYYSENSMICFILKNNIDPNNLSMDTLKGLKDNLKENEITDYGIMSSDGLRQFQLKQYKEELSTNALINFLLLKILHYGNNLGDTNLMVVLQGNGKSNVVNIDFEEVHQKLKQANIKSDSEILVAYNEFDENNVVVRVFPELALSRTPRILPSQLVFK